MSRRRRQLSQRLSGVVVWPGWIPLLRSGFRQARPDRQRWSPCTFPRGSVGCAASAVSFSVCPDVGVALIEWMAFVAVGLSFAWVVEAAVA